VVPSEGHVHARKEAVHAVPEVERTVGRSVNAALPLKDEQGIRYNVDEIHVMVNDKSRFFVCFHRSSYRLCRLHSSVSVQVCRGFVKKVEVGIPAQTYSNGNGLSLTPRQFLDPLREKLEYEGVDFIQPDAWISEYGATMDIKMMVGFARQMATLVDFATEKEAKQLKIDLNAYIRDGDEVVAEEFANYQLVRLWCLVKNIKTEYMKLMRDNFKVDCFLGNEYVDGEGYVMTGEHGTYKLVNRWVFSHHNFNAVR